MSKSKSLNVVSSDGSVDVYNICKIVFLLILSALSFVAALAVNETVQKILERYVKKDNIIGYVIYAFVAIALVFVVAYLGCKFSPDLSERIDLSPM